ncbi:MAG: TetR/AcrR family transcriptional regulator [Firmicutes bacterium]|nr:TetR/AcrR family transcriptional regulator [Bacillota bacterium]
MRPGKNKEAIVESSLKLFCSKGFGNTSIKEIAIDAGVSQGNIYNYFSTKEEIFEHLFCEKFPGNFIELFIKGVSYDKTLDENIETVLDNLVSFADENLYFFKLIILDANEFGGEYLRKYSKPFNKPIEDYFVNSIRLPGLRKDIDSTDFTRFFAWLLYALGLTDIIYVDTAEKTIKNTPEYKILLKVLKKGLGE